MINGGRLRRLCELLWLQNICAVWQNDSHVRQRVDDVRGQMRIDVKDNGMA